MTLNQRIEQILEEVVKLTKDNWAGESGEKLIIHQALSQIIKAFDFDY